MQLNPFHKYFLTSKGSPARWRRKPGKRDEWFTEYQQIGGRSGQRDLQQRKHFFRGGDFADKTVLDVGCNLGQMSQFAADLGAREVVGVDYDKDVIKQARELNSRDNVFFVCDDLDNYFCFANLANFDTALYLSVIGNPHLQNPLGILAKISDLCNVCYLEGHWETKYEYLLQSILNYTTFTQVEYLGLSYDNTQIKREGKSRHIFRCAKAELTADDAIAKIIALLKTNDAERIALVGNAGVGKSTLLKKLTAAMDSDTELNGVAKRGEIAIVDDIDNFQYKQYKKLVYAEYRGLKYMRSNSVTAVFFVKYDIKTRLARTDRGPWATLQRSPRGLERHYKSLRNIYSIVAYKT